MDTRECEALDQGVEWATKALTVYVNNLPIDLSCQYEYLSASTPHTLDEYVHGHKCSVCRKPVEPEITSRNIRTKKNPEYQWSLEDCYWTYWGDRTQGDTLFLAVCGDECRKIVEQARDIDSERRSVAWEKIEKLKLLLRSAKKASRLLKAQQSPPEELSAPKTS